MRAITQIAHGGGVGGVWRQEGTVAASQRAGERVSLRVVGWRSTVERPGTVRV